jgi:peptidoglycan/xylan/chitin deacetylase (PgdA/CDA1 family)
LLDDIWAGEPFANHGAFVARVAATTDRYLADGLITRRQKDAIQAAAAGSDVGAKADRQIPNSCADRIAITFDDGPSFYRPETLRNFRDKQVHGVFFDLGMRAEANPAIERFSVREGHVLLSHTYNHTNMNDLSDAAKVEEVRHNEASFDALGAPFTFHGIRTPFGSANTHTQEVVSSLGYTYFLTRIETGNDYEPATTTEQIVNSIVGQLRPGGIIGLHDGPIDTPAGRATTDAVPLIIDAARQRGYCFGVVDRTGQVVADRYVSSGEPIPQIAAPVPYNFMERPGTPPDPWFVAPDPIAISATHGPEPFRRGQTGNTLTLTVTNTGDRPSDPDPVGGSVVTVRDQIPPGLRATSASGPGWTCSGSGTRTCRRTDTLAAGASYPPITITVDVAADAPATITNSPTVTARGQGWKDQAVDPIGVE